MRTWWANRDAHPTDRSLNAGSEGRRSIEVKGAIGGGHQAIQFPEQIRRRTADLVEDALAHMPVFVGIAQPPQQMPTRLIGAG